MKVFAVYKDLEVISLNETYALAEEVIQEELQEFPRTVDSDYAIIELHVNMEADNG